MHPVSFKVLQKPSAGSLSARHLAAEQSAVTACCRAQATPRSRFLSGLLPQVQRDEDDEATYVDEVGAASLAAPDSLSTAGQQKDWRRRRSGGTSSGGSSSRSSSTQQAAPGGAAQTWQQQLARRPRRRRRRPPPTATGAAQRMTKRLRSRGELQRDGGKTCPAPRPGRAGSRCPVCTSCLLLSSP
jgi:hypothetical protein